MFSSNPKHDCGSKCDESKQDSNSDSPKRSSTLTLARKGWTMYIRFILEILKKFKIFTSALTLRNLAVAIMKIISLYIRTIPLFMKRMEVFMVAVLGKPFIYESLENIKHGTVSEMKTYFFLTHQVNNFCS